MKKCKFCFHGDSVLKQASDKKYYYKCEHCGYVGPLMDTPEAAEEAWNIYNTLNKEPPPCGYCGIEKVYFPFCPMCGRKM